MKPSLTCILLLSSFSLLATAYPPSQPQKPKMSTLPAKSAKPNPSNHKDDLQPTATKSRLSGTHTSSTTQASQSPTKDVDVKNDPYAWEKLKCENPTVADETMDPQERWDNSGATQAWGAGFSHFGKHDTHRKFSQSLSDFFGGPPNVFYGEHLKDETNCQTVPDCSDDAAHGFNSSGGYIIMRSMLTLNQVRRGGWNFHSGGWAFLILDNRRIRICGTPSKKEKTR